MELERLRELLVDRPYQEVSIYGWPVSKLERGDLLLVISWLAQDVRRMEEKVQSDWRAVPMTGFVDGLRENMPLIAEGVAREMMRSSGLQSLTKEGRTVDSD